MDKVLVSLQYWLSPPDGIVMILVGKTCPATTIESRTGV